MEPLLVLAVLISAALGLLHAISVFRRQSALAGGSAGRALYAAAWTLLLWVALGTYVLTFWVIGAVGLALSRLLGRAEVAR